MKPIHSGGLMAALLSGIPDARIASRFVQQPISRGATVRSLNGGHRRKKAIRAVRLRKGGRCRFGRYT